LRQPIKKWQGERNGYLARGDKGFGKGRRVKKVLYCFVRLGRFGFEGMESQRRRACGDEPRRVCTTIKKGKVVGNKNEGETLKKGP